MHHHTINAAGKGKQTEREDSKTVPLGFSEERLKHQEGEDRQQHLIERWQEQERDARLGNCLQLDGAEVKVIPRSGANGGSKLHVKCKPHELLRQAPPCHMVLLGLKAPPCRKAEVTVITLPPIRRSQHTTQWWIWSVEG